MKNSLMIFVVGFVSSISYAGGSMGGGGFGVKEEIALINMAYNIESLPKTYIGGDDFRRVKARLSVAGTQSITAVFEGEKVDLRTFRDSLVDVKFSKEILPSD